MRTWLTRVWPGLLVSGKLEIALNAGTRCHWVHLVPERQVLLGVCGSLGHAVRQQVAAVCLEIVDWVCIVACVLAAGRLVMLLVLVVAVVVLVVRLIQMIGGEAATFIVTSSRVTLGRRLASIESGRCSAAAATCRLEPLNCRLLVRLAGRKHERR